MPRKIGWTPADGENMLTLVGVLIDLADGNLPKDIQAFIDSELKNGIYAFWEGNELKVSGDRIQKDRRGRDRVKENVGMHKRVLLKLLEKVNKRLQLPPKKQDKDTDDAQLDEIVCVLGSLKQMGLLKENEISKYQGYRRLTLTLCGADKRELNLDFLERKWEEKRSINTKHLSTSTTQTESNKSESSHEQEQEFRQSTTPIPQNLKNSGIPQFVGRETVLNQLHEKLQKVERVAISTLSGMGGIGKTELALRYAWQEYRKGTYQGGVCWVNVKGNDPSSDIISFFEYKLKLDKPQGRTSIEQVQDCWHNWIDGDVLIIFDDVRNAEQIFEYLPPYEFKKFKVIITTRCEYLSDKIENIHLEELSEDASLDLLRSYVGNDRIDAEIEESKLLCQDLGYLPLALELIARLLKRRSWTIQYTINELRKRGLKKNSLLGERHPEMTAKEGVKAAFDLSWHELDDEPKTQKLALYLSLFAVAPIQQKWINELFPNEDKDDMEKWLIDNLVGLNLVKSIGNNEYELHRLIHLYLREKLEKCKFMVTAKQDYCQLLVKKSKRFTQTSLSPQQIEELKPLVPHIKEVTQHYYDHIIDDYNDGIPTNWNLSIKAINSFYVSQGFYPQAIQYFREYIDITKKKFGESDIHLMVLYNDFSLDLKDREKYSEALELLNQALLIATNYLGKNHYETMMITNAIGDTYRQIGDYEQAEQILSELLPKVLPQNIFRQNIKTVYIYNLNVCVPNNLGLVYSEMKRYAEAKTCFRYIIKYFEGKNENTYYFTQASDNLGTLLTKMKRYEEAEFYLKKALEINKRILDRKHLSYRLGLGHLASLCIIKDKLDEAEKLFTELFELQLELNYLEPEAINYLHYIASQYFDKGLYRQVEKVSLKINKLYQKFQLINSMEYCESLNLLGKSCTHVNKLDDAVKYLEEAIEIGEKSLSRLDNSNISNNSHTSTSHNITIIESYQNLGMALWNKGQKLRHPLQLSQRIKFFLEAEKQTKHSLNLCQPVFEHNNNKRFQHTISSVHNNLGLILEDLEKYSEAENSYRIALQFRPKELGNEHYLVGQSLLNLAACYDWQKKNNDQIEEMLLECKRIWEKLLDSNHPEIIHCYSHLAGFYDRTRQFKKAISYYQKTIENCRARQDHSIYFYQQKLEECIKRSQKLKPKKSSKSSNKSKGFG